MTTRTHGYDDGDTLEQVKALRMASPGMSERSAILNVTDEANLRRIQMKLKKMRRPREGASEIGERTVPEPLAVELAGSPAEQNMLDYIALTALDDAVFRHIVAARECVRWQSQQSRTLFMAAAGPQRIKSRPEILIFRLFWNTYFLAVAVLVYSAPMLATHLKDNQGCRS